MSTPTRSLLSRHVTSLLTVLLTVALVGLTGCDQLLGPDSETGTGSAELILRNSGDGTGTAGTAAKNGAAAETPLTIEGEEGDLVITDFRFVLTKLRFSTGEPGEFRGGPKRNPQWLRNEFVDVPLDISEEEALGMLQDLPEGTYTSVDVKIDEDAIDDDDDAGADALRDEILAAYPDWPEEASMVAVGRFEPNTGDSRPFTVYLDAEVRVHLELDPPLVIEEGTEPTVTVDFDPELLFQQLGEPSLDLSRFDGQTVEIEVNVKDSFEDVKFEMDGEEDDDDEDEED